MQICDTVQWRMHYFGDIENGEDEKGKYYKSIIMRRSRWEDLNCKK